MEPLSYTNVVNIDYSLMFELWLEKGEYLGLAKIYKDNIETTATMQYIKKNMLTFFRKGIYLPVPENLDSINKQEYSKIKKINNTTSIPRTKMYIEEWWEYACPYCLYTWLAHDYITNRGFDFPMCALWNPTINKYQINPGGNRLKTYYLFGGDYDTFLTFNTGGKFINWIKLFKNINEFSEYFPQFWSYTDPITIHVIKNWNSLTPRVRPPIKSEIIPIIQYQQQVKTFFNSTKINANFDMSSFGYNPNVILNHTNTIDVNIDKITDEHIARALLLMPLFKNYSNHGISIKIKN